MNWLRAFMAGRNGVDQLGIALVIVALAINFLAQLTRLTFLSFIAFAVLIITIIRALSKNLSKRREENRRFLIIGDKIKGDFDGWKDRRSQSKHYKFFTCPGCKNKLRVPRGKGKIQITCPRCGQRFRGKS